jgi:hypothetical protein
MLKQQVAQGRTMNSNQNFTLTTILLLFYSVHMKWQAAIILFAIIVGFAVPPALPLNAVCDKQTEIGVLDFCHSATPALSSNGDMPFISALFCRPFPLESCIVSTQIAPPLKTPIIASQDEHPPKC